MSQPLVWITRSQPGAQRLAEHLLPAGYPSLIAPVLKIVPVALTTRLPPSIDIAVALSEHAVLHAPAALWDRADQIIAVGAQTAQALAERGQGATHPALASSEGLLEGPLRDVRNGQTVALVSGRGGRRLLADRLAQAGARVVRAEVYARQAVATVPSGLAQVTAIVVSSGDGFEAAGRLWFEAVREPQVPVFAPSERVAAMAADIGFSGAENCGGANPEAVLTALRRVVPSPTAGS